MKPGDLVTHVARVLDGTQGSVGIITDVFYAEADHEYFSVSAESDALIWVLWPDLGRGLHYPHNLEVIREAG